MDILKILNIPVSLNQFFDDLIAYLPEEIRVFLTVVLNFFIGISTAITTLLNSMLIRYGYVFFIFLISTPPITFVSYCLYSYHYAIRETRRQERKLNGIIIVEKWFAFHYMSARAMGNFIKGTIEVIHDLIGIPKPAG